MLLEKLIMHQLMEKFLAFYGTLMFITVFTRSYAYSYLSRMIKVRAHQ